ncbi:MAG: GNAT family N-acetyltransferase, partial [Clostridiales Family XIII bacterium]|nr:GNAT family N-acetyltransferase [Clostridiales Family XIII bacterium]
MREIRYKRAEEEDLQGFMDCLKSVYGDADYYERFYDPDYVRSRLDRIFVAESESGIVGGLVLSDWGFRGEDRELSTFIVRKGFAGHDIGSGLLRYTLDAISQLPSVKGANVTHHTVSQILTERNGYLPTGLMFGVFIGKSTLIPIVRNFNVRDIGTIFVPDALLPAAERLYRMLGVNFDCAVRGAGAANPIACNLWYEHDRHFQFVDVDVIGYGEDCVARG